MLLCLNCQDKELPTVRTCDEHYGVAFTPEIMGKVIVTLNHVDVTDDVFQFQLGGRGWVALYSKDPDGKRVMCENAPKYREFPFQFRHGIASEIHIGRVEMRSK